MHNLFLVYFVNLYMFRAYLGSSSGGTTICPLCWLDCSNSTSTTDSYLKRISTNCCIHILRISCAWSWFFFTHYFEMHGQQNIKFIFNIPTQCTLFNWINLFFTKSLLNFSVLLLHPQEELRITLLIITNKCTILRLKLHK